MNPGIQLRKITCRFGVLCYPAVELLITLILLFSVSFATLSSNGFGDIIPVSKEARTLSVMETMTGMFYVAVLISRLVSMYAPASAAADGEIETEP